MSLRKFSVRSLQLRPGRTILTLLSIVIGVAAAVAVSLLTDTTRGAYRQMFATVTGKATLEIDAAGGAGFDQAILGKVRGVPGIAAAVPLVKRPSKLYVGEKEVRIQIMGIDPELDRAVRDYDLVAGQPLTGKDELLVDEEFARTLGMKVGDEVGLLTKRLKKPFKIAGLVRPRGGEALRQASLAFLPLKRAQYYFNPRGRTELIDAIQIVTDYKADRKQVQTQIAPLLSQELNVHEPAGSTQLMRQTLLSSEKGLQFTTLFMLVLALFIVLNTLLMSVGERRRQLAIMRAIGATRLQLAGSIIVESLLLGLVGSLIGMGVGIAGAMLLVWGLGIAMEVKLPPVVEVITWQPLVMWPAVGMLVAVIGALVPALRIGRISPLEGMSRNPPTATRNWSWLFGAGGLVLIAAGAVVIYESVQGRMSLELSKYGGISLLMGLVFLEIVLLPPQAKFVAWLLSPLMRVESGLALKQILRHNTRSALTVGVLFIAGATGIGIANSILDNVKDVRNWYSQAIVADYFVRAMMPDMATGTAADLPDGIGEELQKVIGPKDTLDGIAFVEAKVPAPSGEPSDALTVIAVARTFPGKTPPAFDLIEGDATHLREQLEEGKVIVGSVLAQKLNLKAGDFLPLETASGIQKLPIVGVANEYMVGGLAVHMHRNWAAKYLGVEGVDGYAIKADNPADLAALRAPLEKIAAKYDVLLQSNADITRSINRMVNGVEWSLWLLVILGFVVAAFGIVNTLTMNVLEQTRELGLLRIVAMTKAQVRRTIRMQALIIGGVGLPAGLAAGVVNAYIMNQSMEPLLGHPVQFHLYPGLLIGTFVGAVLIVLIAAVIPARRASRIDVVEALHYE